MFFEGITDVDLFDRAREILLIMGEYFQIQDDYLGERASEKPMSDDCVLTVSLILLPSRGWGQLPEL